MHSMGMEPVSIEIIDAATLDPAKRRTTRRRPRWGRIIPGVALMIAIPGAPLAYWLYNRVTTYRTAIADNNAGRAITPDAILSRPQIFETHRQEQLAVTTATAIVTLHPRSRLSLSTATIPGVAIGAIDGDAEIVVAQKKPFALAVAGVAFLFNPGRYRVSHPIGKATRIDVDSGSVFAKWGMPDIKVESDGKLHVRFPHMYGAGSRVTATPHDSVTTVTAVGPDGKALEPFTADNLLPPVPR